MLFRQRLVPGLAAASYVVGDESSGQAAVIDPLRDVDDYLQYAAEHGLQIRHILETHVHADFVVGSAELRERLDGNVSIHCSGEGGAEWVPPYADSIVQDGDSLSLGALRFKARHTPGHTPEHLSWELFDDSRSKDSPWLVFTGDFLFVGDVGRPDLLGQLESEQLAHELYASVFERTRDWPDFTEIYPAHGSGSLCGKSLGSRSSSTLGYEREFSEVLSQRDEESWTRELMTDMPAAPPYFSEMKRVNRQGPRPIGQPLDCVDQINADAIEHAMDEESLVVDVRSKEAFAAAHLPGSINLPINEPISIWAGWTLPYDRQIMLIADSLSDGRNAALQLRRVGFDNIGGVLSEGIDPFAKQGRALAAVETITAPQLQARLERESSPARLLDVRSVKEWRAGHIAGAEHCPLGELSSSGELIRAEESLEPSQPVCVICGSGYRGAIAASLLQRHGIANVANVLGGMQAWQAAKLPVVQD